MFGQIWQWLKKLWQKLFGIDPKTRGRKQQQESQSSSPQLSDTDYEFLFTQLLEGTTHGWHEGRVVKFFHRLEERGKEKDWVAWLERFGEKVLANPSPNHELGSRMMQLGEVARSVPSIDKIGQTSYSIGRQLLTRQTQRDIWEYDGPDATPSETTGEGLSLPQQTMTLEELIAALSQDSQLRAAMAQQLGIEPTDDPQVLVQALIAANNINNNSNSPQPAIPSTDRDWFHLGLQQADDRDFDSAIASWDKALELNPKAPEIWHNRGSALANLKKYEEAIASFDRAVELKPDDSQAWSDRGTVLYIIQRWEDALASWDRAVAIKPDLYQIWFHRGLALEALGRVEESLANYDKALEIKPSFQLAQSQSQKLRKKINKS